MNLPGLTSLTGGGGLSAGGGGPSSAQGGANSTGINFDFSANNAFQVGGSGGSSQSASADKGTSSSNTVLYIALAVLAAGLAWSLARKH